MDEINLRKKNIMIERILLINLLVHASSIYSANIENIENKETNIINWERESAFICAIQGGSVEGVKLLIDAGVDINVKDRDGESAFICAIRAGNVEIVKLLIDAGADINAKDKDERTYFIYAIPNGSVEIIKLLIKAGSNINAKDKDGKTVLIHAIQYDKFEIVELLINLGADINIRDKYGEAAFMYAIRDGNVEIVKLLINAGAKVNTKAYDGRTALEIAQKNNNQEIIYLIKEGPCGVNILYSDILIKILSSANNLEEWNRLLYKIIYALPKNSWFLEKTEELNYEALQIINKYLENRFKKDYKPEEHEKYYSAIKTLAEQSKYKKILNLLKLAKIDPPMNEKYKMDNSSYKETLAFLIIIGADPNIRLYSITPPVFRPFINNIEETAIICAARNGWTEMVTLLINAGADINTKDQDGNSAIIYAARFEFPEITALLINAGVNVNAIDKDRKTAITYAVQCGNVEMVALLIFAGADVNKGVSTLRCAVQSCDVEIVKLLINAGADVNVKVYGLTPLSLAQTFNNQEIIDLIKNAPGYKSDKYCIIQ